MSTQLSWCQWWYWGEWGRPALPVAWSYMGASVLRKNSPVLRKEWGLLKNVGYFVWVFLFVCLFICVFGNEHNADMGTEPRKLLEGTRSHVRSCGEPLLAPPYTRGHALLEGPAPHSLLSSPKFSPCTSVSCTALWISLEHGACLTRPLPPPSMFSILPGKLCRVA